MADTEQNQLTTNVDESITSAGRLDKMLESDSPLMKRRKPRASSTRTIAGC